MLEGWIKILGFSFSLFWSSFKSFFTLAFVTGSKLILKLGNLSSENKKEDSCLPDISFSWVFLNFSKCLKVLRLWAFWRWSRCLGCSLSNFSKNSDPNPFSFELKSKLSSSKLIFSSFETSLALLSLWLSGCLVKKLGLRSRWGSENSFSKLFAMD